jgi:maleate cis-trans isomerase
MIAYGDRARLGVLVPSGNAVAEPELRAMLPPEVGMVVTRLPLRGSSEAELLAMAGSLESAAGLLADARPDAIAFHCTAVSTFDPAMADGLRRRIKAATGLPALATADALLAAVAKLGARRVLLVTPYIEAVHAREAAFLEANGMRVVGGSCMGIDTNAEMAGISPAAIGAQARAALAAAPHADLCLVSCTAIRSGAAIGGMEAELGVPVVTSNQALAWYAMRALGLLEPVRGFGRLLSGA